MPYLLLFLQPVVVAKEIPEKSKPINLDTETMEVPCYENADDNDMDYEDDSVGEIEIVEVTEEPEETDSYDLFPEEKIVEEVPDEMPIEIEMEEKVIALDLEQFENKAQNFVDSCEENEPKAIIKKEEIECVQIKDESIEKNEIEIVHRSPDMSKMKR